MIKGELWDKVLPMKHQQTITNRSTIQPMMDMARYATGAIA